MTTKAGRIQPKDVRQGKTLWQVTIEEDNHPDPFMTPTYSAFITPVFPVTLAFSITDNINTGFFFYHKWVTGALEMSPLSGLDLGEENEDGTFLVPTNTAFFKSKKRAEKYIHDVMLLDKHFAALDASHMPMYLTFAERGPTPDVGAFQVSEDLNSCSINIGELQQLGVEKANELFALQEKENDGRGITCVRDIINYLIRKDIAGAKMITDHDWDKIANYSATAQWLKDYGFADANAYVVADVIDPRGPCPTNGNLGDLLRWKMGESPKVAVVAKPVEEPVQGVSTEMAQNYDDWLGDKLTEKVEDSLMNNGDANVEQMLDLEEEVAEVRVQFPMSEDIWNKVIVDFRGAVYTEEETQETFVAVYATQSDWNDAMVSLKGMVEYKVLPALTSHEEALRHFFDAQSSFPNKRHT